MPAENDSAAGSSRSERSRFAELAVPKTVQVDGAVRWETPWAAEHAFAYAVGDIRCLERRIRTRTRKDGSVKTKVRYYLCGNDGTDHQLSKQSGVDLDEFVAVLTRQGVALDEVAVERFR